MSSCSSDVYILPGWFAVGTFSRDVAKEHLTENVPGLIPGTDNHSIVYIKAGICGPK
jgi:hypothetical protein